MSFPLSYVSLFDLYADMSNGNASVAIMNGNFFCEWVFKDTSLEFFLMYSSFLQL